MLQPLFTIPQGVVLQPIFFQSKGFVDALREDVNTLLTKFSVACNNQTSANDSGSVGIDEKSPFETFKQIWTESGFYNVFLLVVEPSSRQAWWEVLTKCFIERILPNTVPDLIQLGAFYSLYTLFFSQPDTQENQVLPVKLAISTIKQIMQLPKVTPQSPLDTHYIIKHMFTSENALVYIIPDILKDYPPLPTNRALTKSADQQQSIVGTLAIGIKQELDTLASGPNATLIQASNPSASAVSTTHLHANGDILPTSDPTPYVGEGWASQMRQARTNYMAHRDAVGKAADAASIAAAEQIAAQRIHEARINSAISATHEQALLQANGQFNGNLETAGLNLDIPTVEPGEKLFGKVGEQVNVLDDMTAQYKQILT